MQIEQLLKELNEAFPIYLQEPYDNTGAQIVFGEDKLSGVLISLDINDAIIEEAKARGCNLIISHHPFFFKPIKCIDDSEPHASIALKCIYERLSLYAAHTNLDRLFWQKLGESLGFKPAGTLLDAKEADNGTTGFGSFSETERTMQFSELLHQVKSGLGLEYCLYAGEDKPINTIAFLNGAGGGSIEKVLQSRKVDCIVTGDVNYHNAMYALEHGTNVIDAGHYGTEKVLLTFLMERVRECLTNAGDEKNTLLCLSEREENPFKVFC